MRAARLPAAQINIQEPAERDRDCECDQRPAQVADYGVEGENAILRLPVTPEWDERLERLMLVPIRREARIHVSFEVEARTGSGGSEAR